MLGGRGREGPKQIRGGGALGRLERPSGQEHRVFSLSRNPVLRLGEDRSSLPRLGLGGEAALRVGLGGGASPT